MHTNLKKNIKYKEKVKTLKMLALKWWKLGKYQPRSTPSAFAVFFLQAELYVILKHVCQQHLDLEKSSLPICPTKIIHRLFHGFFFFPLVTGFWQPSPQTLIAQKAMWGKNCAEWFGLIHLCRVLNSIPVSSVPPPHAIMMRKYIGHEPSRLWLLLIKN
jgi:hypothetical protein